MTQEHSERLYGLDHLRSLAIILVLMYHYRAFKHPLWIESIGKYGWTGVDLFFVLSGFLISSQLFVEIKENNSLSLKTFYIKRFFRIIPPYFFTVFLYFTFPFFRERETLPALWKFVTFTQNYGLDVINKGTFSHAWSLCIEEQFYFCLPLLLLALRPTRLFKYIPVIVLFVMTLSLLARFVAWNEYVMTVNNNSSEFWRVWYMKIYYPTHTRLDGLGVGVLIGFLMQYSSGFKKIIHDHGNLLFFFGIMVLGITCWICNEQASKEASVVGFTMVALSYGLIVLSAVSNTSFLARFQSNITTQLAVLSYAIYLSHKGIIHMIQILLDRLNIQTDDNACLIICLAGCITGGLLYRFVIEKPFSGIKHRILTRKESDNGQGVVSKESF